MAEKKAKREGNLRWTVLGLVGASDEGKHAYALKHECEAVPDDFWVLNYGQIYRVLDELTAQGNVSLEMVIQNGRPNKKVYRITEKGRQNLDDWLLQPPSEEAQPLRDELAVKLLFCGKRQLDQIHKTIEAQRGIYMRRLSQIARRRRRLEKAGIDLRVTNLVMQAAEIRLKADLSWLESLERSIVRGALD